MTRYSERFQLRGTHRFGGIHSACRQHTDLLQAKLWDLDENTGTIIKNVLPRTGTTVDAISSEPTPTSILIDEVVEQKVSLVVQRTNRGFDLFDLMTGPNIHTPRPTDVVRAHDVDGSVWFVDPTRGAIARFSTN